MARADWVVGGDRRTAAADLIYAAATELVVREGWDAFNIDALAAKVHCSRATIYRYAGGKAQIREAVVMRMAAGIVNTVRRAVDGLDGPQRVVTAISVALEQIRADPIRRLVLSSTNSVQLSELHSLPLLRRLAADLSGLTDNDAQAAQWIVHVVMSLTYLPIGDKRTEHDILRRFVAPAFTSGRDAELP